MECSDVKCPVHGEVSLRGKTLTGVVVSDGMRHTVVVKRDYLKYIKKYNRYEKRSSKIAAHNSPCMHAKRGDKVTIKECRPLSKTKHFAVIQVGEKK